MLYTDLNKHFENKYKISKTLLKEELDRKVSKTNSKNKFLEGIDKILTERHWKFTVPGNYRNAIFEAGDEEDFDGVRYALMDICQYVIDHIEESEDFEQEELEMIIDDYSDLLEELDYQDFEDEDECNYWLNELYDLMDNTDIFLGLREDFNIPGGKFYEPGQEYANDVNSNNNYPEDLPFDNVNEEIEPYYAPPIKGDVSDISELRVGDKVKHSTYGIGVIDKINNDKVYVAFDGRKGWRIFDSKGIPYLSKVQECLKEDTVKQNGKWVNKGKEGTHGTFKTKKEADAQRKAMFATGYNEALKEAYIISTWGQTEENPKQVAKDYNLSIEILGHSLDETTYRFSGKKEDLERAKRDGYFYSDEEEILDEALKEEFKLDSRENEILDDCFAYLRAAYGDERFIEIAKNFLGMDDEELDYYCDIHTDFDGCLTESEKFGRRSIKFQLSLPENIKILNDISKITDLKTAKSKFIGLIKSLDCTDQNKNQAILKINNIKNINGLYSTIGTYLTGSRAL